MKYGYTRIFAIVLATLPLIYSCGNKHQATVPPQEITVVLTQEKDVPIINEFIGEVHGEKDIPIRARVEGYLEGIFFNEGDEVKKGQLLYTIDPEPFEAKVNVQMSEVAEARTMLAKAESDLDRIKPLAELNAVSKSDLDAAQAQYDAYLSAVDAAKANLKSAEIELGYTKMYSPINGLIGMTKARVGDFVGRDPNPVILNTVSETKNIKVRFYITENEYLYISRQYVANLKNMENDTIPREKAKIDLLLSDGSVYEHPGTVDFIDRGINPTTGSILVQADFPNPDFILRPGLYAKVRIPMRKVENAILVPQRCISELQGLFSVFVVSDSNMVESRQITLGPSIGDLRIVEEGLKANEKVVIDALQRVQQGMTIRPKVIEFESKTNQL